MKKFINDDCMNVMKNYSDNYFDIAIVDPPYFSGPERRGYYGSKKSKIGVKRIYHKSEFWSVPNKEYFDELFRVSKNQIIWGCNYFNIVYPSSGRIIWDKCNGTSPFSDCEIAYCSLHNSVKMIRYMWNGMLQGKSIEEGHIAQGNKKLNEKRIHPTQKPIKLYEWLIKKYCKKGDIILDTHVGSGSSLIAFEKNNFDYVGCEIDPYYFDEANKRICREREHDIKM